MISVVIAVYNGQDYIERSLRSVLEQSKFNLIKEIILIDDGSTDKTVDIAKKIYRDIVVIKKKNGGCESAKNLGIEYSKSDFICFLDVDDFWHKDKIKIQVQNYKNHPNFDVFVCNSYSISGEKNLGVRFDKEKIFCNKKTSFGEITFDNYIKPEGRYSFHPPSSLMVKKKIFYELGFHDEKQKQGGDSDIFLRWVLNDCKIYFDSTPLLFYETNNQNSLTKNFEQWSKYHFLYWLNTDISKLDFEKKKKFISMRRNTLLSALETLIKNGKNSLARKLVVKNYKLLISYRFYKVIIISFFPIFSLRRLFSLIRKIIK